MIFRIKRTNELFKKKPEKSKNKPINGPVSEVATVVVGDTVAKK